MSLHFNNIFFGKRDADLLISILFLIINLKFNYCFNRGKLLSVVSKLFKS